MDQKWPISAILTRFNQTDSVQSNRLGSKKSDQKWPISAILIRFGLNLGLNSLKFGQEVRPKLHQKSQNSKKTSKKAKRGLKDVLQHFISSQQI